jgi:Cytochrome b/b6/petB
METQAFTGVLLAFNYAPTPGDAYASIRYIVRQVTGGQLVRGLHHWGASMLIVVVVLQMIQVARTRSPGKPPGSPASRYSWSPWVTALPATCSRGITALIGGTVVTNRIAGQVPIAGP